MKFVILNGVGGHPLPSKELWPPPHLEGGGRKIPQLKMKMVTLPSKGGGGHLFSKVGDGHPSLLRSEVAIPLTKKVGGHLPSKAVSGHPLPSKEGGGHPPSKWEGGHNSLEGRGWPPTPLNMTNFINVVHLLIKLFN